jgi:hypothetical protein
VEESVAPDEGDEGEVAVQARPGPSLVGAAAELVLPGLVGALHGPALVRQAELVGDRAVVQRPGEVPFGLAVLSREGTLTNEPAERAGGVAMIAAGERASLQETARLLRSPANATRLLSALQRALRGERESTTVDQLRAEADSAEAR